MKVQYISDIHTEFMSAELQIPRVVRNIRAALPDADTIVLAGDVGSHYKASKLTTFLSLLCPLYKNVIYVLGNHEYYTNNPEKHTITEIQNFYRALENTQPN
jgi:predicted phosphodiesterase